ncbi:MAG: hypothetical protein KIT00_04705, partial [Rhodospirillales bacterium]|nr:hypothetical protein [Rhodospirillales bacterium]
MTTAAALAAKLLDDAATFFRTIADQNPSIRDQMLENADVFRQVSALVGDDPLRQFGDENGETTNAIAAASAEQSKRDMATAAAAKTVFRRRPGWVTSLYEGEGPDAGDRMLLGAHLDKNPWKRCTSETAAEWCDRIAQLALGDTPKLGPEDLSQLATCTLWTLEPPFFDGGTLVHAVHDSPPMDAFFLSYSARHAENERRLCLLTDDIGEVHRANAEAPLLMDGAEVDYFLYFMHLVRAEEGIFRVLIGPVLTHVRAMLGEIGQGKLAQRLTPPRLLALTRAGGCLYEADIVYGDALFHTKIEVRPNGQLDMREDAPILVGIEALNKPPQAD